ncbi:MAG: metal ABC transporter substrate-binding protein, partial [Verrucomicrobiae bacterium]|nr:metal ABC transporter substrate-binding protein [Verrucomicrobiae bacterium]
EDVIAKASVAKKPEIYVIAKGLESSLIYEFVNGNRNNTVNPHFWLDPMLMKHAATNVALKLKNTFTASEKRIDENLKKFSEKMDELDRFITKQFSNIKKRPVICLHNAFSYFAKRYEIEIAGVIEETPDLPSSPQQITKIISIARSKKVCAVFGEIGSSGEIARRVAEELKVPFAMIDT